MNQAVCFAEKTENVIIGRCSAEVPWNGRKILKENEIPSFEELDFTFRVMGRILWQRFR